MSNRKRIYKTYTTAERRLLKEAGWTVHNEHGMNRANLHFDLDYGDGDVRPASVVVRKIAPMEFKVSIPKIDTAVMLRTIEEVLQHVEDRVTVLTAIGVLDPEMRNGKAPESPWTGWNQQIYNQLEATHKRITRARP